MVGLARRARGTLCLLPALVAGTARAADDADIYALIDTLKPVAEAIVVDGNPSDWGAIPAFPDPGGDAGGDTSRDITSVRIAPTSNSLAILIQTAGAPSTAGYAFWIRIDFMGEQHADVELALDSLGADGLSYFEETGCSNPNPPFCSFDWDQSEFAIGSAVEIRVPYAALDAVLPPAMQGRLTGGGARSWLRVQTYTVDYDPFYADYGAAVASFRLVATPYTLDPPLPPGGDSETALPNPLPGLWYVGQGAFTHGTHAGYWGYDLHKTDNALHPESPPGSTNLTDNFSFGQPILAPVAGTVYSLENTMPDHPPYDYSDPGPPNFLFLEIPGNLGLLFSHTKQGTIPYAQGNSVSAGAFMGRVGHSGSTSWPHLHYGAEEIDNGFQSHPLGISNAKVGLNPTANDPWRRDVVSWGIREGFFVLPEPGVPPAIALGAAVLAALAQLRAPRRRR
jgi:hypothetical protein